MLNCRNHFIKQIDNPNLSIDNNVNSDKIFNWTVDLHNNVNKMNHKKIWSYDEARSYYQINNYNNGILKFFIFQFIKTNYKKNPEKTGQLIRMIKTLAYLHPNEDKRNKLIEFKEKFDLNRNNIKSWIYAFLVILKS